MADSAAHVSRALFSARAVASPRAVPEQLRRVLKRVDSHLPWSLLHRGEGFLCPLCGGEFGSLRRMRGRPNAKCPRCGSLERHRAIWLYLKDRTTLLAGQVSVLHMAPEPAIERVLRPRRSVSYTGADLEPERRGIVRADITALPFADASFDLVLCNHVLEHVPDDRTAIRELHRVLRPGGTALIQNPIDDTRADTYEDPSIVAPADRLRAFGQRDHVRIYGRDFAERLRAAGFTLSIESPRAWQDDASRRCAVVEVGSRFRGTDIHVAAKPTG